MKIRVLLADDHPVVLSGLAAIVAMQPDMEVAGQARDGDHVILLAASLDPDVTLLDLHMPKTDGWTALAAIRARRPGAKVIALSSFLGDEDVQRALDAGARGYLPKDAGGEEIAAAIRAVFRGQRHISHAAAAALSERADYSPLSPREIDVLAALGRGLSNREIAADLGVGESTVKQHVGHILIKLRVPDRTGAVLKGIDRGLIRRQANNPDA